MEQPMSARGATDWTSAEHSMGVRTACLATSVSSPLLCPIWMRDLFTAGRWYYGRFCTVVHNQATFWANI